MKIGPADREKGKDRTGQDSQKSHKVVSQAVALQSRCTVVRPMPKWDDCPVLSLPFFLEASSGNFKPKRQNIKNHNISKTLNQNDMLMTMHRSKPEIEFQYGGRPFSETGSSFISAMD